MLGSWAISAQELHGEAATVEDIRGDFAVFVGAVGDQMALQDEDSGRARENGQKNEAPGEAAVGHFAEIPGDFLRGGGFWGRIVFVRGGLVNAGCDCFGVSRGRQYG